MDSASDSRRIRTDSRRRMLSPGGMVLILTPNAAFVDPSVFDDPTHVRLYRMTELASLMRETGFEIVDLRTLGLPWFRGWDGGKGLWRLRRFVLRRAEGLSRIDGLRERGQTLCYAARKRTE